MDLFEIIGPVMIGPSSSHTAGAARIGRVTRKLLGERVVKADIGFHGSFAMTWKGHGTDRAVVGGLMDMEVDDTRLRQSIRLAQAEGMEISFHAVSIRDAHPNTVVVEVWGESGAHMVVQAASVGGGSIMVQAIDGIEVSFSGENNTLIVNHGDVPGAVAQITGILAWRGYNIATMNLSRTDEGGSAVTVLELDCLPTEDIIEKLRSLPGIERVTLMEGR